MSKNNRPRPATPVVTTTPKPALSEMDTTKVDLVTESAPTTPPKEEISQQTEDQTQETATENTPAAEAVIAEDAEQSVVQSTAAVTQELSLEAKILQERLAIYTETVDQKILIPQQLQKAADTLILAVQDICAKPTEEMLDIFYDFQVTHRDGLMREDMGLRGMHRPGGKDPSQAMVVYGLFRKRITKNDRVLDIDDQILRQNGIPKQVVQYLRDRKKK